MSGDSSWQRIQDSISATTLSEGEETIPYAVGRVGQRPQMCITFEKSNGSTITLAYSHLYCIHSESPAAAFVVEFSDHKVMVQGQNLNDLFRYIGDHKARHVQETPGNQSFAAKPKEPVIETLRFIRTSEANK